jgi:hypothetical protein
VLARRLHDVPQALPPPLLGGVVFP